MYIYFVFDLFRVPWGRPKSLQRWPWGGPNRSQGCPAEVPKNRSPKNILPYEKIQLIWTQWGPKSTDFDYF